MQVQIFSNNLYETWNRQIDLFDYNILTKNKLKLAREAAEDVTLPTALLIDSISGILRY